jgi:hypothetical protein
MTALACIGEPISWLRLETFASGRADATTSASIREHVGACPACKHCLDEIHADVVALPPLALPAAPARAPRAWWKLLVPAFAVAAAAVLALVLFRTAPDDVPVRENVVAIKGVGEVVLGTVRERSGVIRDDVRSFTEGDRWKLVVTCPPSAGGVQLAVDVTVVEVGSPPDRPAPIDRPLAPAQIACGNRVVLPGAFSLTGPRANRVCVAIGPDRATACVTIAPE